MKHLKKLSGTHLSLWECNQRIRPLAIWQRQFRPALRALRVFAEDFDLIGRHPEIARRYGFQFSGAIPCFMGFEVIKGPSNAVKYTEIPNSKVPPRGDHVGVTHD